MLLAQKTVLVPWNKDTAKIGCELVHKITGERFILRGVKGVSMFVDHEEISPEVLFANYWAVDDGRIRACAEEKNVVVDVRTEADDKMKRRSKKTWLEWFKRILNP